MVVSALVAVLACMPCGLAGLCLAATNEASAGPTKTRLPAAIYTYLAGSGCQAAVSSPGLFVLKGHFFRTGQTDWAVSCVSDSVVHLFVFPAGDTTHVDEVVQEASIGNAAAQLFTLASPKTVLHFQKAWGEAPSIRRVTHDGIEQRTAECCSVIHYWHGGQWWTITGMD